MAQPGLETLFQNMGPTYGASMAGQREAMSQQQDQANLQSTTLANQHSAAMNPLLQQQQQGLLAQQQAQLPGIVGQSAQQFAAGQTAMGTQPTDMKAKVMEQYAKMDTAQLSQMKSYGEKVGQIAGMLSGVPVQGSLGQPGQAEVLKQLASQYGLDNNPLFQKILQSDPSKLVPMLTQIAQGMQQNSSEALAAKSKEEADFKKTQMASQTAAGASMYGADARVQAQIAASENKAKQAAAHANMEQKVVQITSDPNWKNDPNKVAQYNDIMKSVQPFRNAAANGYQNPEILGQENPAQRFDPAKVSGGTPAPSDADESTVKKAFGSYEPSKYQYRVHNGVVQRAPK